MRTKILAFCAVAGLGAWVFSCSSSDDGVNNGGSGGEDSGGNGGSSSGGKGGSAGKGGSGSGGSSNGGSGGTGGSSVSGGSGGGGAAGGMAGGSGGTPFVAKHPTWDFEAEGDDAAWNNGVDHFSDPKGACDHERYPITKPAVSTEQKKDGTKSLMYDIDLAVAKTKYDGYNCQSCTAPAGADAGSDATVCTPKPAKAVSLLAAGAALNSWLADKAVGKAAVILPKDTVITFNVWFPGSKAGGTLIPYLLGNGIEWTAGANVFASTDSWYELKLTLPAMRIVGNGWVELGVFIPGLPADFKGKVYIDAVDVKLP